MRKFLMIALAAGVLIPAFVGAMEDGSNVDGQDDEKNSIEISTVSKLEEPKQQQESPLTLKRTAAGAISEEPTLKKLKKEEQEATSSSGVLPKKVYAACAIAGAGVGGYLGHVIGGGDKSTTAWSAAVCATVVPLVVLHRKVIRSKLHKD